MLLFFTSTNNHKEANQVPTQNYKDKNICHKYDNFNIQICPAKFDSTEVS